tara:strand:- start:569 stop:742 length:174 start_codon:yes stop_codon:yes gene_type:complete
MRNLKQEEVINLITKKVQLKKDLRNFKQAGELRKAELLQLKIDSLEEKLHSRPLSKN